MVSSRSGLGLGLVLMVVFSGLLMLSQLEGSSGRVIYFNALNSNQSLEAQKNSNGTDALKKGMLFELRRLNCRHGYMYDHHNRCRRIV